MKAGGADASGVEGVPLVAAAAGPEVIFTRRPAAERTTDVRALRRLFFLKLAVWHDDRVGGDGTHTRTIMNRTGRTLQQDAS